MPPNRFYLLLLFIVGLSLSLYGLYKGPTSLWSIYQIMTGSKTFAQVFFESEPKVNIKVTHLTNNGYENISEVCRKKNAVMRALGSNVLNLSPTTPIKDQIAHLNSKYHDFILNHFYFSKSTYPVEGKYRYYSQFKGDKSSCTNHLVISADLLYSLLKGKSKSSIKSKMQQLSFHEVEEHNSLEIGRLVFLFDESDSLVDFYLLDYEELFNVARETVMLNRD